MSTADKTTWKPINESPEGFEPIFSVIEPETGRILGTDLEYYEAYQISHAPEMYDIICDSLKVFDELYIHYSKNDKEFLKFVNDIITRMYLLIDDIPKEIMDNDN